MGMEGNGKPPQWEWELPTLPWEFIPKGFFAAMRCSFYLWMLCMVTVIALNVPSAWLWSLKLNQNANVF